MYKAFVALQIALDLGYPNGLKGFDDDGNEWVCFPPVGENKAQILFHLVKNQELVKKIFQGSEKPLECTIEYVDTLNFEDMTPEEAQAIIDEVFEKNKETLEKLNLTLAITGNRLMMSAVIPGFPTPAQIEFAKEILKDIPGIVRAQVVTANGIIRVGRDTPTKTATTTTSTTQTAVIETSKRERCIQEDDITDVKILLGSCNTVEELLKNM